MSLDRADLMRELELLPAWRLRALPAAAEQLPEPPAASQEPAPAEPAGPAMAAADGGRMPADAAPVATMGWAELKAAVTGCRACALGETRTHTVFGTGGEAADWMFVGAAPGAEEDGCGEPFAGPAGQLLDNMLAAIGLARGDNVYLANVLKCRPPGNRDPQDAEVQQCSPFLQRQVALVRPRLIVALGESAAHALLGGEQTLDALRGRLYDYHGVPLVVTCHPDHLLRSLGDKALAWEDLCLARRCMRDLQSASATPS